MKAILIFFLLDLTLTSSYNREMVVKSVDKYYNNIKESESNKQVITEKNKYIPPADHPWRKNMMLKKLR